MNNVKRNTIAQGLALLLLIFFFYRCTYDRKENSEFLDKKTYESTTIDVILSKENLVGNTIIDFSKSPENHYDESRQIYSVFGSTFRHRENNHRVRKCFSNDTVVGVNYFSDLKNLKNKIKSCTSTKVIPWEKGLLICSDTLFLCVRNDVGCRLLQIEPVWIPEELRGIE